MLYARQNRFPGKFFPFRVVEYSDLETALAALTPGVTYDTDALDNFQPLPLALAAKWYWRVKTWQVDIEVSGYHDNSDEHYTLSTPGDSKTLNPSRYGQKNPNGTWASNVHRNYLGQNGMMNSAVDLAPGPPTVPAAISEGTGKSYKVGEHAKLIGLSLLCDFSDARPSSVYVPFRSGFGGFRLDVSQWTVAGPKPDDRLPDGSWIGLSRYDPSWLIYQQVGIYIPNDSGINWNGVIFTDYLDSTDSDGVFHHSLRYIVPWGVVSVYLGTADDNSSWSFYAGIDPTFFRIKDDAGKYWYYPNPGMVDIYASAGGAPSYFDVPGGNNMIGSNPSCSAWIYKRPGDTECGSISDNGFEIPLYGKFASLSITPKELWDGNETGGHGNGGGGGGGC